MPMRNASGRVMRLLAPEFLFDVVVHGLGEVMLGADDRISLLQNVHLNEPETALPALLQRHVPVLIDCSFSQRKAA